MKQSALILPGLILSLCLVSCGGDIDGFTQAGSSSTNIISAGNFSIGFSEGSPAVLKLLALGGGTANCTDLVSIDGTPSSTITVTAADKDNALVSSGRVYFEVQFGTLDSNSCTLQNGQCSVEWNAHLNLDSLVSGTTDPDPTFDCFINGIGTIDYWNSVTAWSYGVEHFNDNDGDGNLSDVETFTDIDEPYLDRNDNNIFDALIDDLTNADTNGTHDAANLLYDGPYCDTTTRTDCGNANLIPIYIKAFMVIGAL